MELVHTFTVPAAVEDTWAHFMDLEAVGGCFPGAVITDVSGDDFSGTVKVKLGPIALLYAGTGRFVARDHTAYRAEIDAMGKDRRGNGTAGAKVTLSLAPDPEGTRCEVVTDLAVTGKPAQFGRGVMQDVSDKLLQAFLECLQVQLAGSGSGSGPEPGSGGEPAAAPDAPDAPDTPETADPVPDAPAPEPAPAARVGMGAASRPPMPRSLGGSGPAPGAGDALDLGSAVLPVLAKTYGPYLLAGLVGLLAGVVLGRRRRR